MDKEVDPIVDVRVHESTLLEDIGYKQDLKRSFSLLGMIGFGFGVSNCWLAMSGSLIIGIGAGGPPVMIFSWIVICLITLPVAFSLAEICSAYPVAGGQYSWVAILAPKEIARGLSWITGWFNAVGVLGVGAGANLIGANFILGCANLCFPDYTIQLWHTVLLSWLITILGALANITISQWFERIARGMLFFNIASWLAIIITVLACQGQKQTPSFVFVEFQNLTGFDPAMACMIGILQGGWGMLNYEAAAHMTEDMNAASTEAPKAIIATVLIGAVTALIFLIAICFGISDFDSVASTSTGVPMIQIFYNATSSVAGSVLLSCTIIIINLSCTIFIAAESSRMIYAFARDRGLPFSSFFSRVQAKSYVPVNSLWLSTGIIMAMTALNFQGPTAFNTVLALSTGGFYLSYAMALIAVLLYRYNNRHNSSTALSGPFTCGRWGWLWNAIGVVFLLFMCVTFNFPSTYPVTPQNMNYYSAATGGIFLISLVTWLVDGRKNFKGPQGARDILGEH